eukprot:175302_1
MFPKIRHWMCQEIVCTVMWVAMYPMHPLLEEKNTGAREYAFEGDRGADRQSGESGDSDRKSGESPDSDSDSDGMYGTYPEDATPTMGPSTPRGLPPPAFAKDEIVYTEGMYPENPKGITPSGGEMDSDDSHK